MTALTSNLLPLAILLLAMLGSAIIFWIKGHDPKIFLLASLLILTVFGLGVVWVINSTPGGIDVVDDDPRDDLFPPFVDDDELAPLRASWDSEAEAYWPAAELLSQLSDVAYQTPLIADLSFREFGFEQVVPFNSATMFGYVAAKDDVAVIAFRGSESEFGDWWTNISRTPFRIDAGDIHSGFWTSYNAMKSQIVGALDRSTVRHLWICGHSLGGALALCCAYDLDRSGRLVDGVMTFGQPMIARQSLADDIDNQLLGRYVRFVNRNDVVARIPPSYRPCGRLVWFTDDGVKRSKPKRMMCGAPGDSLPVGGASIDEIEPVTEAEFQRLISEQSRQTVHRNADGKVLLEGNSPYFADHSMSLYLGEVRKLLQRR